MKWRNLSRAACRQGLQALAQDDAVPVVGICLSMQLICRSSEEGLLPGLG
ncbi:hypothetical protein [Candidimonas sp. SYP-B2681]|nr:hypothetical protein [Candidimonas sp. SYP-B2681]